MKIRTLIIFVLATFIYACQNTNTENKESFKPSPKKDIVPEAIIFLESKTIEGSWDTISNKVNKEDNSVYNLVLEQKLAPNQDSMISKAGDEIHYIITITNEGDFPIGKYKVENIIPAGLNYLNADNKADYHGGVISWDHLTELKPGEVLELKYTIVVAPMPKWRILEEIEDDSEEDYGFSDTDQDSLSN